MKFTSKDWNQGFKSYRSIKIRQSSSVLSYPISSHSFTLPNKVSKQDITSKLPLNIHISYLQIARLQSWSRANRDWGLSWNFIDSSSIKFKGVVKLRLKFRWIKMSPSSFMMFWGSMRWYGSKLEKIFGSWEHTYSYLAAIYREVAAFKAQW